MSIIIHGMDVPKSENNPALIWIFSDGKVWLLFSGGNTPSAMVYKAEQLPPHGRLIDADKLKVMMPTIGDEYLYAREMIEEAPTVIEAEGERERLYQKERCAIYAVLCPV